MWQLLGTLEPNWAAIPKPMVPSTRLNWTIYFATALKTSSCCYVTGDIAAGGTCLNTQQSLPCEMILGMWRTETDPVQKETIKTV